MNSPPASVAQLFRGPLASSDPDYDGANEDQVCGGRTVMWHGSV
ncbi:hypothetical protein ES319_D13G159000v1 [Gossypium barbadense]|uniref:Uncharacterized protein n=1 Tax=Gossypium barbadense TaxID=3634 RepID=A0A5J5NM69_GOSBA|nr:hypothetical protein ES319_D13G159000v1 [Gossypium barbadense]